MSVLKAKPLKEALLECGTTTTINPDFIDNATPIAIYILKGRIMAIEWYVEEFGNFIDDENIASVSCRIEIKTN